MNQTKYTTVPTAIKPTMAAATASPVSRLLTVAAAGRLGADLWAGAEVCRWAMGAALARGAGAAGAAEVAAGAGVPAGAAAAPVGPPGGKVGNLMVGAAEGLGGRLIRTVSFLGWTLPVSFLGGTAPLGILGMFSAIKLWGQDKSRSGRVKLLFGKTPG